MARPRTLVIALLAVGSMTIVACSGGDDTPPSSAGNSSTEPVAAPSSQAPPTAAPTSAAVTSPPPPPAWAVDTDECDDAAAATAPIGPTVRVGSVMPLAGGVAAAYAPVRAGFEAYLAFAREEGLFEGYDEIELTIGDDQFNASSTPAVVDAQVAAGVDLFAGMIGAAGNTAVRPSLNERCIPQLNVLNASPTWGDPAEYPWTTGVLVPYSVEAQVYAYQAAELHPDGATVGLFNVDNDFGGAYVRAFADVADDFSLEIVSQQMVDPSDSEPPTSFVAALAEARPQVVLAVPIGAGCITFLAELAAAIALDPTWQPDVFITNTCASPQILAAVGAAADGVYTSSNLVDVGDPQVQALPAVAQYLAFMKSSGAGASIVPAAVGWTTAEVTVAILNQAAASADGLTRATIIEAARDLTFTPMLARAGAVHRSHGLDDPFLAESLQVLQYDAQTATFTDVGDLVDRFEG